MAGLVGISRWKLSSQITVLSIVFALVLSAGIAAVAWWAETRIDARSVERQAQSVHIGFQDIADGIPKQLDSSAIWDDAVINARANDDVWLAENLVEWMSDFYGFSRIYLLGANDEVVRAASDGKRATNEVYAAQRPAIGPLVQQLRQMMERASLGLEDSTEAITGLGVMDTVSLPDGRTAIVSARPVVPSSEAVAQAPGTEFVLVAVRLVNSSLTDEIAEKYSLIDLNFSRLNLITADRTSSPVLNNSGRIVGFLSWKPDKPAAELVVAIAPAVGLGMALALVGMVALLVRLRMTSNRLEASQAHAQYLAFHDPLTGAPNRALFEDRLERALVSAHRNGDRVALHYLDIDRFKHVNDTLGHPAGDELIRQVARRLATAVREVDTVARLGGDEFAIIQVDAVSDVGAEALCKQMLTAVEIPFDLLGDEAQVGISIGVALSSDQDHDAKGLMRKADIALYQAKANGRGRFQLFAGDMDDFVRRRRELERDLRAALRDETGLWLAYQPIFDATTNTMLGAEALVRWDHPNRGPLTPDQFVAMAEERGIIDLLGGWVLKTACAFAASCELPWVAVNVSPLQFRDDRFADLVLATLERYDLEPARLELEVTEGLLLQNSVVVQATLNRLRAAGVRIALDDFGTGYSSISYLRTYGVDKLKIDRSFVDKLGQENQLTGIVRSIIDLAGTLSMQVTAEGVETEAQRQILVSMHCAQLQGYLLSKPVTEARLLELLQVKGADDAVTPRRA